MMTKPPFELGQHAPTGLEVHTPYTPQSTPVVNVI